LPAYEFNIAKNISVVGVFKLLGIVINLLSVTIFLTFFNNAQYGLWITITSFLGWFSILDLGIGNGLRNKLVEALINNDTTKAKSYISSAYFFSFVLFSLLAIIAALIFIYVDWQKVFNTNIYSNKIITFCISILIVSFLLQFILKLILTVLYANHKSGLVEVIQTILAGVNLGVVWSLSFNYKSGMFLVTSLVYSILPLLLLLIINLVCFKTIFEKIKPSLKFVNIKLFDDIMGLGAKFLLLQIAYVVIFSTDNYLIAKFFNVSEVTVYTTHYKLFSIIPVITGIFYNVLWSPITDAMARRDKDWLKLKLKQIRLIMIILFAICLGLLTIGPIFLKYWTLSKVPFSFILSLICAVYVLIMGWNTMFGLFANASSKVKLQVYLSFVAMILNIPICIFLIRETTLGIFSIPIAGIVCMLPGILVAPIQAYRIVENTSNGVWNQ